MSVSQTLRKAGPDDVPALVGLMTEFYAEAAFALNPRRASAAFAPLLADERLGLVWFIRVEAGDIGYVVVTFSYSMEYGGPSAIVDDFFIRPAFRGLGIGKAALAQACQICAERGARAMHVETGDDNQAALAVYRRVGFADTKRVHLTLKLAEPTHAP